MPTSAPVDIGTLITRTPGVNGGKPCVHGVGVSVHQLAVLHNEGMSVEQIARSYDGLSIGLAHAALAYYLLNREWIDAELETELELYRELATRYPGGLNGPEPLQR